MSIESVIAFINDASMEELDTIVRYTNMARKRLGKQTVRELSVGDTVSWTSGRKRGRYANKTFTGIIRKVNKTRVKVEADHNFGTWNVPGSMLTRVA